MRWTRRVSNLTGPCEPRSGSTLVECAITLPVVSLILFAMLDLGLAAVRHNALSEAARCIAREAILHGSLAPATSGTWGPDAFSGTAADSSELVASAQNMLPTMEQNQVSVELSWPDSDNSPRDRVQVAVEYQHVPLIPSLFPWGPLDLRAVTTMHIVN